MAMAILAGGNASASMNLIKLVLIGAAYRLLHVTACLGMQNLSPTAISVSQSSTFGASYAAALAVDGNPSTFSHTAAEKWSPWWALTLPAQRWISTVIITNRLSAASPTRLQYIELSVDGVVCGEYPKIALWVHTLLIRCHPPTQGTVVKIQIFPKINETDSWHEGISMEGFVLHIAEVEVYSEYGQLYAVQSADSSSSDVLCLRVMEVAQESASLPMVGSVPWFELPAGAPKSQCAAVCAVNRRQPQRTCDTFIYFTDTLSSNTSCQIRYQYLD